MTIAIDSVCTDRHLETEVGGASALANLLAKSEGGSSVLARQAALDDTMRALRRRAPPIFEADLADVTELRAAVAYGALMRLYRQAATTPDSIFLTHAKTFAVQFEAELDGLSPTLCGGDSVGATASWSTERR